MVLFGNRKKKISSIKRFKITYLAEGEPSRYVIIHALHSEKAKMEFLKYYYSPGDQIKEICYAAL